MEARTAGGSIRLAANYALHHVHGVGSQDFTPLDHLRNIEPPVSLLDAADIAVSAIEAASEFSLRYFRLSTDCCQYRHDPAVPGCPELLRQCALSPKVSQRTLP